MVEVEIEVDGDAVWVPATIQVMCLDSTFSAEIEGPNGDTWVDWFTWEDEGTDWRRTADCKGFRLPIAAPSTKKAKKEVSPKPPKPPKPPTSPKLPKLTEEEKRERVEAKSEEKRQRAEANAAAKASAAEAKTAEKAALAEAKEAEKAAAVEARALEKARAAEQARAEKEAAKAAALETKAAEKEAAKAAALEAKAAEKAAAAEAKSAEKAAAAEKARLEREASRAAAKTAREADRRNRKVLKAEDDEGHEIKLVLRLDCSQAPGGKAPPKMTKKRLREAQEAMAALDEAAAAEAAKVTAQFWAAAAAKLPKTAEYTMAQVQSSRDLTGTTLVAPSGRVEWFLALGELMAVTEEATRRHGESLKLDPAPTPMPTAYVAQRLDFDDPLWGWQVRDAENGWLQGYITLTTFTTWSADFEWDSRSAESGLPAARIWNARLRNGEALEQLRVEPGVYVAEKDNETLAQVAAKHGLKGADLVALNKKRHKGICGFSKLLAGTEIQLVDPSEAYLDRSPMADDTPQEVAARHALPLSALLAINQGLLGMEQELRPDTHLGGRPMKLRDRKREVSFEYLNPTVQPRSSGGGGSISGGSGGGGGGSSEQGGGNGAKRSKAAAACAASDKGASNVGADGSRWVYGMRKIDEDGSLTERLAQLERQGDPAKTGVVWPRIAELGLLVSLGGGGVVLRYALQQLQAQGWYEYVVCQATLAAVGFYERVGFVRVGAVAKYAEKGVTSEELAARPVTGYRHWADADELMEEADFGEASYLMALDLRRWEGGAKLELSTTSKYPPVRKMEGADLDLRRISECTLEGGHLAYESGDGIVVTLMADCVGGQLDAAQLRMEIRYEVEAILAHRGSGSSLEYLVKWAKWREITWEPAENLEGATEVLKAYHETKPKARPMKKKAKTDADATGQPGEESDDAAE
jgi:uncharacterized membrane protein YgcG